MNKTKQMLIDLVRAVENNSATDNELSMIKMHDAVKEAKKIIASDEPQIACLTISGGVVAPVSVPEGVEIRILDYDIDEDTTAFLVEDDKGDKAVQIIFASTD